jgi:hypothetical protein
VLNSRGSVAVLQLLVRVSGVVPVLMIHEQKTVADGSCV